jgi:hypothetical protein
MGLRLLSGHGARQSRRGIAADFDGARAEFEAAWRQILPTLTEANFQEWRDQRDWTASKYAMWERGERMPSQKPSSMVRCACGEMFDSHRNETYH